MLIISYYVFPIAGCEIQVYLILYNLMEYMMRKLKYIGGVVLLVSLGSGLAIADHPGPKPVAMVIVVANLAACAAHCEKTETRPICTAVDTEKSTDECLCTCSQ